MNFSVYTINTKVTQNDDLSVKTKTMDFLEKNIGDLGHLGIGRDFLDVYLCKKLWWCIPWRRRHLFEVSLGYAVRPDSKRSGDVFQW
jgi:hypothetical protein